MNRKVTLEERLRAEVASAEDGFVLEENDEGVTAWPSNGMGIIEVHDRGQHLECGHQRPAGWP